MTQLCWDIWPEVTRCSQYSLITSSPALSPPAQWSFSSHQTQGRAEQCIITTHRDNISLFSLIYREFWNTTDFCGEREGWILWETQIMLETGISWLSEIVSCQDVTWILNITSHHINPVSAGVKKLVYSIFFPYKYCEHQGSRHKWSYQPS